MTEKVTLHLTGKSDFQLEGGVSCDKMNPKVIMLYAAALCSGKASLMIMQKEHVEPQAYEITLTGELSGSDTVPESVYNSFHIVYNVSVANESDQAKISHAIRLTHDKYCGMMQMLRKIAPVTDEISVVTR